MPTSRSVLFVTNSELGQASVILAVAHEFLLSHHDVHIASFPALQKDVKELNDTAARLSGGAATTAKFQIIAGRSMKQTAAPGTEFLDSHPPGIAGALFAYDKVLPATFAPWNGAEYMSGYSSIIEIMNKICPELVVVDPLLSQGVDACNFLGKKCMILSPNTFKELILDRQPNGGALWKFPAMASGFPYPLPWSHIPANIYLIYRFLRSRRTNPRLVQLRKYREACGITGKLPCMFEGFGGAPVLLPSTPAIDFDFFVPPHVTACGPITRPFEPLEKTHLDLSSWLKRGPTVLINLGSHVVFDQSLASQFAAALRLLLNRRPDVQILWKLKTKEHLSGSLDVLFGEIHNERVRIETWLPAQPIAILKTGHIACMVHHGGSNSYHEAIFAGVPQIVLPVWIDTYDFALRVEYLGIGIWGNRTAAPRADAFELGKALVEVVDGDGSAIMAAKARELAIPFQDNSGRRVAYQKAVEMLNSI